MSRDGLGFLVVHPRCEGPCRIEMTYDGGWEYRLCRVLSVLTILGILGYSGARSGIGKAPLVRRFLPRGR